MFELYYNYFKWLFKLHPVLAENGTEKGFQLISVEDAYADFRANIPSTGFFFRLIDYSWRAGETGGFQYQKKQGGFIIAKMIKVRTEGTDARIVARNQCETIANDFFSHMVADSKNGHPLFSHNSSEISLLNINVQPLLNTGDGSYDGCICTFVFSPAKSYDLDCHPVDEWQELSPHDYGDAWDLAYEGFLNWTLNDGGDWLKNEET